MEADSKISAMNDFIDINEKIVEDGAAPYDALVMEFEPAGHVMEHVVTGGKKTLEQLWRSIIGVS